MWAMARDRQYDVPGTQLERLQAFVWYGIIVSLWLGFVTFYNEFFHKVKKIDYEALPKRTGEVVVLTGGTRGIGYEILKKCLQLDYNVILGVRNPEAGLKTVESLRKLGIACGKAKCLSLDLKSLKSVRRFGENVLKDADRIDLLINNAGIMFEPFELTEDGFEQHFQVNYLSHFLLTKLLLPKIRITGNKRKTHGRIINVSSVAHIGSKIDNIKEIQTPRVYSPFRAYFDSKMCQILTTKYLNSQLNYEGANVRVNAVHPGVIVTELYTSLGVIARFMHIIRKLYRSTNDGAEQVMYAAISPEIEDEGGLYIVNTRKTRPHSNSENLALQKSLWDASEACINDQH